MSTTTNRELILSYLPKEASQQDRETFIHICERTGLDPVLKQIHPVKRYDSETGKWSFTFQTSIDGYRLIAERTERYAPGRESTYEYDKDGNLFSATSYVKKMTKDGTWHEVAAKAIFSEYAQMKKDGTPTKFWKKMGHVMIAKCAEALALRKAFPDQYTKLYTDDEMFQATPDEEDKAESKAALQSGASNNISVASCPPNNTINKSQSDELELMLEECDPSYQSKFWTFLKEQFKIDELDKLPTTAYQRIKTAIYKKREEFINQSSGDLAHV